MARWGLRFLELTLDAKVLDCGCGGGANIKRLLKKCPEGIVKGIDYSLVSVEKSKKVNEAAIAEGRCTVPVSYTHLDVYKRQVGVHPLNRKCVLSVSPVPGRI